VFGGIHKKPERSSGFTQTYCSGDGQRPCSCVEVPRSQTYRQGLPADYSSVPRIGLIGFEKNVYKYALTPQGATMSQNKCYNMTRYLLRYPNLSNVEQGQAQSVVFML
jgi:hypothetical protein